MTELHVAEASPADAEAMLGVIRAAFGARPVLDPPSTATAETPESVRAAIGRCGGLLAIVNGVAAGAIVLSQTDGALRLGRVSVDPGMQGRGVASAMVGCAEQLAADRGLSRVELVARVELPETQRFWQRRGYHRIGGAEPNLLFAKAVPRTVQIETAEQMQAFGRALAGQLRAGDLVVLAGELGAGKTTLTQGIGAGLGIRGPVTSPTFVIARLHRSNSDGPALLHVDGYRLGGVAQLDDLDLDNDLEASVTVVEWGTGLAEVLSDDRLEITLARAVGDTGGEQRSVRVLPRGARWARTGLSLPAGRPAVSEPA